MEIEYDFTEIVNGGGGVFVVNFPLINNADHVSIKTGITSPTITIYRLSSVATESLMSTIVYTFEELGSTGLYKLYWSHDASNNTLSSANRLIIIKITHASCDPQVIVVQNSLYENAVITSKINTIDTIVDEILVDTGTTLSGKIDTIDGIVDSILIDTGTTLDGKINTIDGIVDSILVDTGTTLDGKINTLTTRLVESSVVSGGDVSLTNMSISSGVVTNIDIDDSTEVVFNQDAVGSAEVKIHFNISSAKRYPKYLLLSASIESSDGFDVYAKNYNMGLSFDEKISNDQRTQISASGANLYYTYPLKSSHALWNGIVEITIKSESSSVGQKLHMNYASVYTLGVPNYGLTDITECQGVPLQSNLTSFPVVELIDIEDKIDIVDTVADAIKTVVDNNYAELTSVDHGLNEIHDSLGTIEDLADNASTKSEGAYNIVSNATYGNSAIHTDLTTGISDLETAIDASETTITTKIDDVLAETADIYVDTQAIYDAVVGAIPELTTIPAATPTLKEAVQLLYQALRNRKTQTASDRTIAKSDNTVIGTASTSDNGTTLTVSKLV